jgi:hypothetical protein
MERLGGRLLVKGSNGRHKGPINCGVPCEDRLCMLAVVKSFRNKDSKNPGNMIARKQGNRRGEAARVLVYTRREGDGTTTQGGHDDLDICVLDRYLVGRYGT